MIDIKNIRKNFIFGVILLLLLRQLSIAPSQFTTDNGNAGYTYPSQNGHHPSPPPTSSSSSSLTSSSLTSSSTTIATSASTTSSNASSTSTATKFVVWMLPFPPKDKPQIYENETLLCGYSNACKDHQHYLNINLRELSEETFFQNYVRDHIYHKVRHMDEFPLHIQAIAMAALLHKKKAGSCVRMLGDTEEYCDYQLFNEYDPYDESDNFNTTKYPLRSVVQLVEEKRFEMSNGHNSSSSIVEDITSSSDKFAFCGQDTRDFDFMQTGQFNSGEDIQSFAGALWLPFVNEIKFKSFANFTGYFIANSYMGDESFETDEQEFENMNKVQMLSIYSRKNSTEGMLPYIKQYSETIEPFGSRSSVTNQILRDMKIRSYFSACLTLTLDLEGGTLGSKYRSFNKHVFNEILKPDCAQTTAESLPERNKIVVVDVQDRSVIPESIMNSPDTIHLTANIPGHYPNHTTRVGRHSYSYKLLSIYARQAKVIITSRIHVGLPATGLGVPVIFVHGQNDRLPGGKQKVGRVEGLLDIFHEVKSTDATNFNWTFGNLTETIPLSDGVHKADRYRASFWHRLKKTHYYADTARLFGIIPFQRIGRNKVRPGIQDTFHFVLALSDLTWQTQRAIEHVFFHHPNSKIIVHSNDIYQSDLEVFVESGYDLSVQEYDAKALRSHNAKSVGDVVEGDDVLDVGVDDDIIFLVLQNYGGVYVSKSTLVAKEISKDVEEGMVVDTNGRPAIAIFNKDSDGVLKLLQDINQKLPSPSWSFPVLSNSETFNCASDINWELTAVDEGVSNDDRLAVTLDEVSYTSLRFIKMDTECFRIVEESCIYCDELHWEY
mmetsp:Transcript_22592/g.26186  ORF Transcript_22592/g.26186 Transcript_22592/m.26186 type:complete len:833 (-) Transcript_22592:200-2698(-)